MSLVIDIGNTQFKVCVFHDGELLFHEYYNQLTNNTISLLIKKYNLKQAVYSDTRGFSRTELEELLPKDFKLLALTHKTPLPIKINYETPETLGKDRIAGLVGASTIFPGKPCLVVDIGTALTLDFIDGDSCFRGGIISPGPELRYRALYEFTGKLPKVDIAKQPQLLGTTTKKAMQSGVQNGIEFEINGYILRLSKQYSNLNVILTGGYAFLFDKKINYPIFADSFLVPKGLYRILKYNENTK